MIEHAGSHACYVAGCRRAECRRAHADTVRTWRAGRQRRRERRYVVVVRAQLTEAQLDKLRRLAGPGKSLSAVVRDLIDANG